MYKNMKIEINEEQPLDEVVKELERLGFRKNCNRHKDEIRYVVAFLGGAFWCGYTTMIFFRENTFTLAELKEM